MKTTDTRAFANQFLICVLVTIGFGGLGLVTAWVRHQNAVLAKSNRALEARLVETNLRLAEVTSAVESEKSSDVLRRRNADWRLGFAPAADAQIQRVPEDPIMRLARLHNRDLFNDGALPVTISLAMKP